MSLRIVADDLTGALDAAAPFARADAPVSVLRDAARVRDGAWALDAATRGGDAASARSSAERIAPLLGGAGVAFRKIDSLLRGHVAAEIAATARAGGFASIVVAPAFPAQGRITRGGRQFARGTDGSWNAADVDLQAALAATTVPAPHADRIAGRGMFLCDAETDANLLAIVAAGRRLAGPILWCGSAGLARALAGGGGPGLPLPAGPVLGVVGSRHAAATGEVDRLRLRQPHAILTIESAASVDAMVALAGRRLRAGQSALLALRLPALAAAHADTVLHALATACAQLGPRAVYACGGDTLAALFDATGAERLDVAGEIAPGVPLSLVAGGRWNGASVVSKSGAFAQGDVPVLMFDRTEEKRRAQA